MMQIACLVIPSPIIALAMAFVFISSATAQLTAPQDQPAKALEISSAKVDGSSVPWKKILRTKPAPRVVMLDFGPTAGSGWDPFRLRYKLEGWENNWQTGGGYMFLMVRFCNEAGERIAQEEFDMKGESPGWDSSLTSSPLTHRREIVTVPPNASRLWIVISSAGPPSTVGICIVDSLVVSRLSAGASPAEILLRSPFDREGQRAPDNATSLDFERKSGWLRDGSRPGMAKILEFGHDPTVKGFAILDEDPAGHAEWHNIQEKAPRVTPGERVSIEWNEMYSIGVANLRFISPAYEFLPPGDYRFRVSEVDLLGKPTGVELSLPIHVPVARWKTPWFWALVSVLLTAVTTAGVRSLASYKMRRIVARLELDHAMESERLRIAQDIHDDLGARITQISLFSAMAQTKRPLSEEVRADFEHISHLSRDLVSSLYETVWAVDPENDNLESLGDFICETASQLCESAQLRCCLKMTDLPSGIQISSHVRHSLVMAAKEAIHNAIKHANSSELTIRVEFKDLALSISIQDNGRGFQSTNSGNGLFNMKRRLEILGGVCSIESNVHTGTTVELQLKLPPPESVLRIANLESGNEKLDSRGK